MPTPITGASSSMHEKCRWSPKGIALDCTCPTVRVGGAALALAWSWWRRSRRPWRKPARREGAKAGVAGRASTDNTPVVRLGRRPTVAQGTVVVWLRWNEGGVEDDIRVITGRGQQLGHSRPSSGPAAPVCHRKTLVESEVELRGLDGRFLCRHQPWAARTLGVGARHTLRALHHLGAETCAAAITSCCKCASKLK